MKYANLKFFVFTLIAVVFLASSNVNRANAQVSRLRPELSVAGFQIGGDEEATRAKLSSYSPRYDNDLGRPQFFFYNEYGNQVMSLTGYSRERPFLLVAIDVFAVGENYLKKHFQMKDNAAFVSESGFFIGARPSATSLIFAIPNVTGPNEVIKKKGVPDADEKDGKVRTLRYRLPEVAELETVEAKLKDVNFSAYTGDYRFYKNKLSRFTFSVAANNTNQP